MNTDIAAELRPYAPLLDVVFGEGNDPMPVLEERARKMLRDYPAVIWEGDATNFHFLYVSASAEKVFGYPRERWTSEPGFWTDTILHPGDRDHAISYCALCTGKGQDHDFEYRAVTADGRTKILHDVVKVVKGRRGVAVRLRGIMIDVTPAAGADQPSERG